ncbi:MAG: hypothetical protein FJX55_14335 [Alphaproteobacteria bacterium]|nr:hypothetical protein [Alphaproteobacteria bacterium]
MKRREFIAGFGLLVASPSAGQDSTRKRIGVVRPGRRPPDGDIQVAGIAHALREFGHVDGTDVTVVNRFADDGAQELRRVIAELIKEGVDILVTVGLTATLAAREATQATPIVALANVDPVAAGLVTQLGRPTGNVTGVLVAPEGSLAAKRLSLLHEAVPHARRFALLAPADPAFLLQVRETRTAADAAGVELVVVDDGGGDYTAAFARMVAAGAGALVVGAHQFYVRDRLTIIALAERHRLPAIYEWQQQVEDGGLMPFGASLTERYRRLAQHLDLILRGSKPADLPFEQPAMLRFVVSLRAARAIGLELSAAILTRADEVID